MKLLIERGASVSKKDFQGRNCLDIAIAHGNKETISIIIESDHWKESLRNQTMTSEYGIDTPLRQLIKRYPAHAKKVFDKCITTNIHGFKHENKKNIKIVSTEDPNVRVSTGSALFKESNITLL